MVIHDANYNMHCHKGCNYNLNGHTGCKISHKECKL